MVEVNGKKSYTKADAHEQVICELEDPPELGKNPERPQ